MDKKQRARMRQAAVALALANMDEREERMKAEPLITTRAPRYRHGTGAPVESWAFSRRLDESTGAFNNGGTPRGDVILAAILALGSPALHAFYLDYLLLLTNILPGQRGVPQAAMDALGARHGMGHTATYKARARAENLMVDAWIFYEHRLAAGKPLPGGQLDHPRSGI